MGRYFRSLSHRGAGDHREVSEIVNWPAAGQRARGATDSECRKARWEWINGQVDPLPVRAEVESVAAARGPNWAGGGDVARAERPVQKCAARACDGAEQKSLSRWRRDQNILAALIAISSQTTTTKSTDSNPSPRAAHFWSETLRIIQQQLLLGRVSHQLSSYYQHNVHSTRVATYPTAVVVALQTIGPQSDHNRHYSGSGPASSNCPRPRLPWRSSTPL